ncbi:VCBS repeat-containing protein [Chryseolinea sp. T2]|uniref:FG-GAP repeat domain-containing protein n=1 Tax=Chryseolinea sp. T2 TaxID=3129255 RepID=UPI0030771077
MNNKIRFTFKFYLLTCTLLMSLLIFQGCSHDEIQTTSLKFDRRFVAAEAFESVAVLDVDRDGTLDLLSGSFWYKGPDFISRKFIGTIPRHSEYYDDFSAIVMDVNGDQLPDVVTGGWFGATLFWRENPGKDGEWKHHVISQPGNIEATRAWDIDGNGTFELVPNTPGKPLRIYRLSNNAQFDSIQIAPMHGHGLGFGDINGDGRGDFVVENGWIEAPENPFTETWTFHEEFKFALVSVPLIVADVNGDKLSDIIIGQGHDYGLHWLEQVRSNDGTRAWKQHEIDPHNSQYHTMEWTDLDQDGQPELITGKRYRAHDDNDPGAHDPLGLYYFRWNGSSFVKQVISYGPPGEGKGTGLNFQVVDLNGDDWKDIAVAGKDGLCVFFNRGPGK